MERYSKRSEVGGYDSFEYEDSPEVDSEVIPLELLTSDLQENYTEHLKTIENASYGILNGVFTSAKLGFRTSLILNVLSFILGVVVIIIGLIILVKSPESFARVTGIIFSLMGIILVITLLFWKGPLDRILESVANLARINVITIGLAHRLNQVSRVFVQESLKGKMSLELLSSLNKLVEDAVRSSVSFFQFASSKESAESQVERLLSKFKSDALSINKALNDNNETGNKILPNSETEDKAKLD